MLFRSNNTITALDIFTVKVKWVFEATSSAKFRIKLPKDITLDSLEHVSDRKDFPSGEFGVYGISGGKVYEFSLFYSNGESVDPENRYQESPKETLVSKLKESASPPSMNRKRLGCTYKLGMNSEWGFRNLLVQVNSDWLFQDVSPISIYNDENEVEYNQEIDIFGSRTIGSNWDDIEYHFLIFNRKTYNLKYLEVKKNVPKLLWAREYRSVIPWSEH